MNQVRVTGPPEELPELELPLLPLQPARRTTAEAVARNLVRREIRIALLEVTSSSSMTELARERCSEHKTS
jgi:RNase P protein component